MEIQWNTVTWYSKLVAIVFFVATFAIGFYLGQQWGQMSGSSEYLQETIEDNVIVATSTDITLGVGGQGRVGNLYLTLLSVLQDYRCPTDVQCIQAGAIVARVMFSEGPHMETKNMPSDEVPQTFEGHKISIVGVSPEARSTERIAQNGYRVTFHVE